MSTKSKEANSQGSTTSRPINIISSSKDSWPCRKSRCRRWRKRLEARARNLRMRTSQLRIQTQTRYFQMPSTSSRKVANMSESSENARGNHPSSWGLWCVSLRKIQTGQKKLCWKSPRNLDCRRLKFISGVGIKKERSLDLKSPIWWIKDSTTVITPHFLATRIIFQKKKLSQWCTNSKRMSMVAQARAILEDNNNSWCQASNLKILVWISQDSCSKFNKSWKKSKRNWRENCESNKNSNEKDN